MIGSKIEPINIQYNINDKQTNKIKKIQLFLIQGLKI